VQDRRRTSRTKVDVAGHILPAGQSTLLPCHVVDLTGDGARLTFADQPPSIGPEFDFSFDKFRTIRRCRTIWSESDAVGVAFVIASSPTAP
jgi:hypothetical protein